MQYPFTEADSQRAYDAWGANCGPNALAFACGLHIDKVRGVIPGFEEKRYTSPTMMKQALANLGRTFTTAHTGIAVGLANMFASETALVRIQWSGPWTAPGANAKWAYRQTHWICTFHGQLPDGACVFDVNGGARSFASWQREIVPLLTSNISRADGGWFPTHIWRIQ